MEQEKCPFCGGIGECLWYEISGGCAFGKIAPCEEVEE